MYSHDIRLDPSFRDACYLDAQRRGFDLALLGKTLDVGISIADTTYRHLQNYSTRIYIAIFTAVAAHIDDSCGRYKEGMGDFIGRFLAHERQQFKAFDYFASLLRETSDHWGVFASGIVITAGMDFIPAGAIENDVTDMKVSNMRTCCCIWLILFGDLALTGPWLPSFRSGNDWPFTCVLCHGIPSRSGPQSLDPSFS